MELPIFFVVKGSHTREWGVRLDKTLYGLKDADLAWFEKVKEGMKGRAFSNHKWTHMYGIKMKGLYYFMLITSYCLVLLRIYL